MAQLQGEQDKALLSTMDRNEVGTLVMPQSLKSTRSGARHYSGATHLRRHLLDAISLRVDRFGLSCSLVLVGYGESSRASHDPPSAFAE